MLGNLRMLGIALAVVLGLGWLVLHFSEKAAVSTFETSALRKASTEAVAASKADLIAEYQTQDKKAAVLAPVRSVVRSARSMKENTTEATEAGADCAPDVEWARLFNAAIIASNSAVKSARSLP